MSWTRATQWKEHWLVNEQGKGGPETGRHRALELACGKGSAEGHLHGESCLRETGWNFPYTPPEAASEYYGYWKVLRYNRLDMLGAFLMGASLSGFFFLLFLLRVWV